MRVAAPRIMVSATASGAGKTVLTCGLLLALKRRGLRVQAAKCGPDYLDPTFHAQVLGTPSHNLDLFLGGAGLVRQLLAQGAQKGDMTVIEGAMGYYDGIAQGDTASAYDLARTTETPVVLVVEGRGRALSAAAEVAGFAGFREPSQVRGVVFNRVSSGFYPLLKQMVERETGVAVLGYLPLMEEAQLAHRHLGLVDAGEQEDLERRVAQVADVVAQTVDLDALVAIARSAPQLAYEPPCPVVPCAGEPVIAVARDRAFSFLYPDTLRLLEQLGAHLAFFSPLQDACLPQGSCGLYLGGGYPELHARALSANAGLRAQIRDALAAGLPTVAECGGFLYLHESLEDDEGRPWPMVGAIAGRAFRRQRMSRFGYVTLTAQVDSLLAAAGEELAAHEFHYWESDNPGHDFVACKPQSSRSWECIVTSGTLHAGFPHLYLPGAPRAARRFVEACAAHAAAGSAGRCPSCGA